MTNNMNGLNVGARAFVPNVNACEFVPSFMPKTQPQETPHELQQEPVPKEVPVEEPLGEWDDEDEEEENSSEASELVQSETNEAQENHVNHEEDEPDRAEEKPSPPAIAEPVIEAVPNHVTKEDDSREASPELIAPKPKPAVAKPVEPAFFKPNVNIIFIGHVDAGKSTIGGQLLYLTGQVDKRTLEKYEREAKEKNRETWYLSWALDTNLEEREKGKTVECGRGTFDTDSKHFVLLDAPGHKSFVPNMIGGAAQADVAILVISARKGEFETGFDRGGQTREHAMLAKTAGVKHVIILINKMDDPTVLWVEARYKELISKLTPFMKKTGFKTSEMTFIPCSGFTGANLKDPLADRIDPKVYPEASTWYKGPSLLEFLDKMDDFNRHLDDPFKMLISDRYKDMGTIVIGKVESGKARKGETYTLMPNKQSVKVVSILSADEDERDSCQGGENVKVKLSGVEEEEVMPGFVLCHPDSLCHIGTVFDAQIVILEHKSIICSGYKAILHIHNASEEVILTTLLNTVDRKTGELSKTRPRFIKQDTVAIARFKCSELTCLETFAEFAAMGRFTLRDEGKTIAIGKVLRILKKKTRETSESTDNS